jgi:enoyl-CoA hydratase/carnithine racemase
MADALYEDILFEVNDRIAVITLNRPEKLNAWTAAMQASVHRALEEAGADPEVRAIVVTGAGRGFCAGADMGILQTASSRPARAAGGVLAAEASERTPAPALGPDVSAHYGGRFGHMMAIPKPIIAAVNGPCAGIGLVFALFCDLRFASEAAIFTTAFAQRGLDAEHGSSWLLPRLIGPARALDLLLSARRIDSAEAERIGLVNRSMAHSTFMTEVAGYAKRLANDVSPRSLAVMKAQIWKSLFQSLNEATATADQEMALSFQAADFKEGVEHYVEKRPARFTGG